jgi:hypothetical protein
MMMKTSVLNSQAIIPYEDFLNSLSEEEFEKRLAKLSKNKTTKAEDK